MNYVLELFLGMACIHVAILLGFAMYQSVQGED